MAERIKRTRIRGRVCSGLSNTRRPWLNWLFSHIGLRQSMSMLLSDQQLRRADENSVNKNKEVNADRLTSSFAFASSLDAGGFVELLEDVGPR
jgi:hypothetical protein